MPNELFPFSLFPGKGRLTRVMARALMMVKCVCQDPILFDLETKYLPNRLTVNMSNLYRWPVDVVFNI